MKAQEFASFTCFFTQKNSFSMLVLFGLFVSLGVGRVLFELVVQPHSHQTDGSGQDEDENGGGKTPEISEAPANVELRMEGRRATVEMAKSAADGC